MKKARAALLLCSTLFLAACGGSTGGASAEASTTCTTSVNGLSMTMRIHAPAEDKEVDSIEIDYVIPITLIEEEIGEPITDEVKAVIKENEESMIGIASASLGIELEDVVMDMSEDSFNFTMKFKDIEKMKNLIDTLSPDGIKSEDMDFSFKAVKADLESNMSGGCN